MKKIKIIAVIAAIAALIGPSLRAAGLVVISPGPSAPQGQFALQSKSLKVDVNIKDQIATTKIDQVFINPTSARLEGYFLFPVPKGATLKDFAMDVNGKMTEAELLDAGKARKIYEDIVRQMRDPALLEYSEQALFRVRIFPIEPNSEKHITISYSEVLTKDNNTYEYVFPLNTKKYSGVPLKDLVIKVDVDNSEEIKTIYSPSHDIDIVRKSPVKALASYEKNEILPETDFQLYIGEDKSKVGMSLLSFREGSEDGFFFMDITPGFVAANEEIIRKDVTFVLDVSGSMAGDKLEQAKKALNFCIDNLNPGDRFEIIRFSTEATGVFNKRVVVNESNIAQAKAFVKSLKAIGGTNIEGALGLAVNEAAAKDTPHMIIFITDGKPTIGQTDEKKLIDKIAKINKENIRIFTFGVGYDINTYLLDKLTDMTQAYRSYITPGEDIEVKVSNFYTKVSSPVLTDLKLTFDGQTGVSQIYPVQIPDLFKGSSVNIMGRYKNSGISVVTLTGKLNGAEKKFTYQADFANKNNRYEFIPPLWAIRKVGYLLDQIRLNGADKELVEEVTLLAKTYGIITPYTSYLIMEDERVNIAGRRLPEEVVIFNNRARDNAGFEKANSEAYNQLQAVTDTAAVANSMEFQDMNNARTYSKKVKSSSKMNYVDKTGKNRNYAEQKRKVNNKMFYQNGDEWIDLDVQNNADKKVQKVKFASDEYFRMLNDNPQMSSYLSVGKNVRFIYDNQMIEITEK